VAALPETAKRRLITIPESDLILEHFQLGVWIRDLLGLCGANTELLADCRVAHPDNASLVILASLWRRVREEAAADAMIGLMIASGNQIDNDEPLLVDPRENGKPVSNSACVRVGQVRDASGKLAESPNPSTVASEVPAHPPMDPARIKAISDQIGKDLVAGLNKGADKDRPTRD